MNQILTRKAINSSISIFMVGMLFLSCGNNLEEIKAVTIEQDGPDEISENVTLLFSDFGKSKLKMVSPLVHRFYLENDQMKLECPIGMEVIFYDTLQQIESVLTANYGLLLSDEQYLRVKDSVVFKNNQHDTLFTELLDIFFQQDSIFTDKYVKVSGENGVIAGKGLVSNTSFTNYTLNSITDSYIYVKQEKNNE